MQEVEVEYRTNSVSSLGRQQFTLGGGAGDVVRVDGWPAARLIFIRRADGWAVFDQTGAGLEVNGSRHVQWLIASEQTIIDRDQMIHVRPSRGHPAQTALPASVAQAPAPRPTTTPPPHAATTAGNHQAAAPATHVPPSPPDIASTGADRVIRFGRSADCDVVIDDLQVGPSHGELRIHADGSAEYTDFGSRIGTYIDTVRVQRTQSVTAGQVIAIGSFRFRISGGTDAVDLVRSGEAVDLVADKISVVIKGRTIVRSASIDLQPRQLMAVLGPSGSGKSTVVRALSGGRPPETGSVMVGGEDLYGPNAVLRQEIGYVPQDDILHATLGVSTALSYSAELRFPTTASAEDRSRRVSKVLTDLGLAEHRQTAVADLSGGQRKRVNVATELLTAPSLIFLDEPTSGLDPGYEKEVMLLLRSLADQGRTIVVVTHSLQSLDVCDQLLVMGRDGQQAFFGPPSKALNYFGVDSLADIFIRLEREERDWQGDWERASSLTSSMPPPVQRPIRGARPPASRSIVGQLSTLLRRYLDVMTSDSRQSALILAQGPIVALLMLLVMGSGHLSTSARPEFSKAPQVLLALVLGAVYIGASNSVREIVKELPILRRERAAGLGFAPYIGSKVLLLGSVTIVQSLVLVLIGTLRQSGPAQANLLLSGRLELILAVLMTGMASMALGLAVSATVKQQDKAMLVLPVMLFAQFVLSGVSFDVSQPILEQISYLMPARWGFAAVSSTADLGRLNGGCPDRLGGCPAFWSAGAVEWIGSIVMLGVLTALFLGVAIAMLHRRDRTNEL